MLRVGSMVILKYEMVEGMNGSPIPENTLGIVVGLARGVPQVALAGHGIKTVPPHILEETWSGAHPDEYVSIIAALATERQVLAAKLAAVITRPVEFGRS